MGPLLREARSLNPYWQAAIGVALIMAVAFSGFFMGRRYERDRWSSMLMPSYNWTLKTAYERGVADGKQKCGKEADGFRL